MMVKNVLSYCNKYKIHPSIFNLVNDKDYCIKNKSFNVSDNVCKVDGYFFDICPKLSKPEFKDLNDQRISGNIDISLKLNLLEFANIRYEAMVTTAGVIFILRDDSILYSPANNPELLPYLEIHSLQLQTATPESLGNFIAYRLYMLTKRLHVFIIYLRLMLMTIGIQRSCKSGTARW